MSSDIDSTTARASTSSDEHTIIDTTGKFTITVRSGQQLDTLSWLNGRILLSNQCLYLRGDSGKLSIDLADITGLRGNTGDTSAASVLSEHIRNYFRVELGDDVVIISPDDYETFRERFYTATLDGKMVKCKHPAVSGGVVHDRSWKAARLSVDTEQLMITMNNGAQSTLNLDDITDATIKQQIINDATLEVLQVTHENDDSAIETHIAAPRRTAMYAHAFVIAGAWRNQTDVDLTPTEQEVLLALHTGVRPFDIPEFTGSDIETIEATFDQLVDYGILDRVRMRQEVTLNPRGRNIVNDVFDT